jgi:hypothetical protein
MQASNKAKHTRPELKSAEEVVMKRRLLLRSITEPVKHELDKFLQWNVACKQMDSWTRV